MTSKKNNADGSFTLSLDDDLTIYNATRLKEDLLGHMAKYQNLTVDLSGVGEMDSAGLQIMLMLEQEADSAGKELHFVGHSPAVIEVLEFLNLVPFFGDPIVQLAGETSA